MLDPSKTNEHEIEDEMEKYERYTTFMYRPPEMIDKYRGWKVGLKADIWMLGCVLFALCFFKHPFQDAQKLAILNAHYFFPNDNESKRRIGEKLRDLIRHMLTPNPEKRPDIFEIEDLLETWEDHDIIILNEDAQKLKDEELRKQGRASKTPKTTDSKNYKSDSKDISEEEIRKFQNKLRMQKLEEQKKHKVPLHGDYQKKMQEELYSKNKASGNAKKNQKQDDFDWDFDQSSNIYTNYLVSNKEQNANKGSNSNKNSKNKNDFDFDFGFGGEPSSSKPKKESIDRDDFFGFTENQYCTKSNTDDWFDNAKPSSKASEQVTKKPAEDFDFDFSSKNAPQTKTEDLFDFGQPEPKKPKFEDYFPDQETTYKSDLFEQEEESTTGLISNLKKLYAKDGLVEKEKEEEILKPSIPEILKKKEKFTPEVQVKGEEFWEERNNPNLAYQQHHNYLQMQ